MDKAEGFSPRFTSGGQKPGDGKNIRTKLYKRNMQVSNPTTPSRREQDGWGKQKPTSTSRAWQCPPSGWQSLRPRKRNSSQYPQIVMVFSVSPNRLTAQSRTFWSACAHWRRQDKGTILGCSILSGQAMSSRRLLQMHPPTPNQPPPPPPPPPHTHTHTHTHTPHTLPVCLRPWSAKHS